MHKILLTDNVKEQVKNYNVFITCLDDCASTVTKVIYRPYAPWMSDDIHHAIQVKNNAQNKLKKDRKNITQQEYKREEKNVITFICKAISSYYNIQFINRRGNTTATWGLIREIVRSKNCKSNDHYPGEVKK